MTPGNPVDTVWAYFSAHLPTSTTHIHIHEITARQIPIVVGASAHPVSPNPGAAWLIVAVQAEPRPYDTDPIEEFGETTLVVSDRIVGRWLTVDLMDAWRRLRWSGVGQPSTEYIQVQLDRVRSRLQTVENSLPVQASDLSKVTEEIDAATLALARFQATLAGTVQLPIPVADRQAVWLRSSTDAAKGCRGLLHVFERRSVI